MNIWSKSLYGLGILAILTLINIIILRKKTIPVILLDYAFFTILTYKLFGYPVLIYSFLFIVFIGFLKYKNHMADGADFDYSDRIFSVSAIINQLHKPKNLVIGTILPVNHNEIKYNMKKVELDNIILSGGTLITGASGSGKTTTMKTIIKQRIIDNRPVVFFDYKGEEDILDDIQNYCYELHIPYYEFSARECSFTYDPFKYLNETGKVEALMNTRRWSTDGADEHYKTSMQLAIQNLVREYDKYREEHNDNRNYIVGLYDFAQSYHPQQNERDGFNNLIKSLEILLTSKAKELFQDNPNFSFEEDDIYVICFSFTSANKKLANTISSFVYTDIMDRGTRKHYKDNLLLCIDEFGTLESSTIIKDLLEKGRSGGCQTVFSVLDINQIAMTSGEHFVHAILGTINNYVIHAGATQQTAELLAGVQKYDKGYDIMNLRKPYKGKKPTALLISKYPILTKKNNQEVYRIVPYSRVLKIKSNIQHFDIKEVENNAEDEYNYIPDINTLDLSQPIPLEYIDYYLED
ncbi:MAG: type IV secretion system DNA-binding domain-containing protein [Bacilli bacterium]|nr:type IV secretion system DNA-binding domain-containing protein [Bacilli bacterium]